MIYNAYRVTRQMRPTAAAQIDAAQAARPLLQARVNLDNAARFLRPPAQAGDQARPDSLLAPASDYRLTDRTK